MRIIVDREATARIRSEYDSYAPRYDLETSWYDRLMLGDGRSWACSQARGDVLEVAVGTGRNLPFYPPGARVTGIDLSPGMLALARERVAELGLPVGLVEGDAQALPFPAARFDTVICTLGLSSVPDDRLAVREMHRVLRPGGHLVLLGHVASPHRVVRAVQRGIERIAATRATDSQFREMVGPLRDTGLEVVYRRADRGGIVERVTAVKPPA
ncbi:class I SAM-dependent methyltransferase [Qaidamihabitans albus]|uniref:class I SAM-dependent methyltransferase n=1 Tax=Qaidamihabitans albus TaxID=2795733 RepID=UPI0027DE94BD|nr:methyltransferase domain-containing protein [Qaidamihabitans albus]